MLVSSVLVFVAICLIFCYDQIKFPRMSNISSAVCDSPFIFGKSGFIFAREFPLSVVNECESRNG